ncbi:MAG: hypothetical protein NC094_09010 [Bacteroidales bacterium]|nr:hypothetical protein [Lachnoclostridium sp.]MCM1385143.1 hypothetical protein [Lachnoclostridium sp.]MCM1465545.1 hypothetical protein [Bacteroidales bacterium]
MDEKEKRSSKESMADYMAYLKRFQRKQKKSLWTLHQHYLSREIAREYGLTEEQIGRLDEELKEERGD